MCFRSVGGYAALPRKKYPGKRVASDPLTMTRMKGKNPQATRRCQLSLQKSVEGVEVVRGDE